jgi:D-glycero-D-manno-heptose 1,7-bisphosphate phosphatase
MLEVGGRPFLEYLLDEISRYRNFDRILLLAGHLGAQVADRYRGKQWRSAAIDVICEPEPLGTGGALLHASEHLDDAFLLVNGDSFLDINLLDLCLRPLATDRLIRIALKRNHGGDRYGRVEINSELVTAFLPPDAAQSGPINAGIYVVSRQVVGLIPDRPCSLESVVLPNLAQRSLVEGRLYDGYFIDIGVPMDYERAQTELPRVVCRPAVFFDRDGVLNTDHGYVHRVDTFEWTPGAREAVKLCNDKGCLVFVVTNQAGVARGYFGVDAVERLHGWMDEQLGAVGAHVEEFQYCPYHVDAVVPEFRGASERRKPAPGMLLDCMRNWAVDSANSFLVGDQPSDLAAAASAGIRGCAFEGGNLLGFVERYLGRAHA